jgi:hypothetical protein
MRSLLMRAVRLLGAEPVGLPFGQGAGEDVRGDAFALARVVESFDDAKPPGENGDRFAVADLPAAAGVLAAARSGRVVTAVAAVELPLRRAALIVAEPAVRLRVLRRARSWRVLLDQGAQVRDAGTHPGKVRVIGDAAAVTERERELPRARQLPQFGLESFHVRCHA